MQASAGANGRGGVSNKPTIASLTTNLRSATAEIKNALARVDAAIAERKAIEVERDTLLKEVNSLREQLYAAEQGNARIRGYLDAIRDMEPPRMVPEERDSRLDEIVSCFSAAPVGDHGGSWRPGQQLRRWFHR